MLKSNGNIGFKPSHETLADPRNPRRVWDVRDLLRWTYIDQAADAVANRGGRIGPAGARSNLVAIERNGVLGVRIDCDGGAGSAGDLHPDAEVVHDAVRAMKPLWCGLLIHHAKADDEPDWMPGLEPKPVPIRRANGKPVVEYWDAEKRRPAYCLLRYEPEPDHLAFLRGVYVDWWDAMAALALKLKDAEGLAVTGPRQPREPWLKNPVDKREKL